ncbi:MAG: phosphodiester glycosidase family protein [Bacillota bacterium]
MKLSKLFKKNRVIGALLTVGIGLGLSTTTTYALTTYHLETTRETVTKGVEYIHSQHLTEAGLQHVHVLTADLSDPDISFKGIESATDAGLRETARKILGDHDAVAGINGDFFHTATLYSYSFGPLVEDGELLFGSTLLNNESNQYASFFMDEQSQKFFTYLQMSAKFTNGTTTLDIANINKIATVYRHVYIDRTVGTTTDIVDDNIEGIIKIVVENDQIMNITEPNVRVDIPENGYVILIHYVNYGEAEQAFTVGDNVTFSYESSVNFDDIVTGFGGGSLLLENGNTATVTPDLPTGRQPRSAFGISSDGTKAIFLVVDGRVDSIGATHEETAALMKQYGGHNAMHLDGGGSSTLLAQMPTDSELVVQNTVSDGTERKVISAVGIFQDRATGTIQELKVEANSDGAMLNSPITFSVYGLDENHNRIDIPINDVYFDAVYKEGTWSGNAFTPTTTGAFQVAAFYKTYAGVTPIILCSTTSQLSSGGDIVLSAVGDTATISVQAVDGNGFSHNVANTTTYEIANSSIGTISGTEFTAKANGATYIKATRSGHVAYIGVQVGGAAAVEKPSASAQADPQNQTVTYANDGAFYINIVGDIVNGGSTGSSTYAARREAVRSAIDKNAGLAIYGGDSNIQTAPSTTTISWTGSYRFTESNNTSVAMISADEGSISATDPSQYAAMVKDLDEANSQNIIVLTDKTPASFTSLGEGEFFRNVMEGYAAKGKNVLVVISSGTEYWSMVKNGVRYINLPDLWTSSGSANQNFSMLKVRADNQNMIYEVVKP